MRNIIVDTGPLVALFRRRDRDHARVVRFLREQPCMLLTTCHVVTEAWNNELQKWILLDGQNNGTWQLDGRSCRQRRFARRAF